MTPLRIRVVDLLLAAEARTICSDGKAATERHHRLRGKYLANAQFRHEVNATAALVIEKLQHNNTVGDILRRQAAEVAAPQSADDLHEQLLRDYASDPDYRRYIDGLANIVQTGALQMVARGEVPRPEGERTQ
jgi:hypothetical protein